MATILIVDDAYSSREPVARLLRLEGHSAHAAASAPEGLELLQKVDFDLILLDLMMPEMDGVGFLAHLRRDPAHCNIPVIVVTALRYGDSVDQARALGVKAVLLKAQFTFRDLIAAVGEFQRPHSRSALPSAMSAPIDRGGTLVAAPVV